MKYLVQSFIPGTSFFFLSTGDSTKAALQTDPADPYTKEGNSNGVYFPG